jgi:multicomponent K+:H+ antiporter subunit G
MDMIVEIVVSALLVISGVFGLVGSFGLVKLQDTMARLHAPTKATTLGVGGVLIASMLYFSLIEGQFSFHELMITLFLFLTAPITANIIAKAWLHRNATPADLPETGRPQGWSCYDRMPEAGPDAPAPDVRHDAP